MTMSCIKSAMKVLKIPGGFEKSFTGEVKFEHQWRRSNFPGKERQEERKSTILKRERNI